MTLVEGSKEIMSNKKPPKDKSLKDESPKDTNLKGKSLKEKSPKDKSLKDNSLKDKSLKDKSLKDESPTEVRLQDEESEDLDLRKNTYDDSSEQALACARAAIDKKAENVKILDLTEISGFTDYFVIASGTSDRQVQAIADSVQTALKAAGRKTLSVEGYGEGRWVLLDFGDIVVHVFLDALRDYYDLETLWEDAPRIQIPPEFYLHGGDDKSHLS